MLRDLKTNVNGIDIHVVDYGGNGDTIICVHGLTANARFWDSVAEPLTKNFRVIAIDLRGRGDSEKPIEGYTLEQHASDIVGVLDHLKVEQTIFLGHSLGAMIGVCFAAKHPNRLKKLILIDGGANIQTEVIDVLQPSINRLDHLYKSFEFYCEQMKKIPFFQPWNHYLHQYFYADVQHLSDGQVKTKASKEVIIAELRALKGKPINNYHSQIKVPTLIFYAPQCLLHPTAYLITKEKGIELASSIPNSKFVEVTSSNHFSIVFQNHKIVVREINCFLNGEL